MPVNIFDSNDISDLTEDQKDRFFKKRNPMCFRMRLILDIFVIARELESEPLTWLSFDQVMLALLRHPEAGKVEWIKRTVQVYITRLLKEGHIKARVMESCRSKKEYSLSE